MKLFLIFFFFLFCSCKEEDADKDLSANTESVPSIALTEHERIVSDLEAKVSDLQNILNRASEEKEAEKIRTGNIIENLEIEIITLNETLSQFRAEIAKSKGSLREIKKLVLKNTKIFSNLQKGSIMIKQSYCTRTFWNNFQTVQFHPKHVRELNITIVK